MLHLLQNLLPMNFYSSILQFIAKSKNGNFEMQEHSSAPASGFYRKATSHGYCPLKCNPPPRLSIKFFCWRVLSLFTLFKLLKLLKQLHVRRYMLSGKVKTQLDWAVELLSKKWDDWSGWWVLPLLTTRAPTVLQNIKVGKVTVLGKLPKIFTCAAMCQSSVMPILRLSKKLSQFSSRTSAFPIALPQDISWSFLAARAALYLHR